MQEILFLGAGNMARALIAGLVRQGWPATAITVCAPHAERREALAAAFGVHAAPAQARVITPGSTVILAVKPKSIGTVLAAWQGSLSQARPLLISVAAGVPVASLQNALGEALPVVRAMPNTPAQIGAGATALFASPEVNDEQRQGAAAILGAVGSIHWLEDEGLMDIATALSGSGPAYVLLFLEALEDAAVAQGLDRPNARALALQTVLGTARMAAETGQSPTSLRHQVTSPGGTTAAALAVWEEGLRSLAQRALMAAAQRSRALAPTSKD
ncbi:pyrroline-5-carboxylate reductase [Acidithiobacillus sulfuriphilus]|uniref:pyrroline-5-carboxylate reductase n=1 Tax=Acidithiobacillus sulfuriphilus TaxID=1867749 RepID=UPI003F5EC2F4